MADMESSIHQRWSDLTSWVVPEVQQKWWETIRSAYTEPHRHYHTLRHLAKLFHFYDLYKDQLKNKVAVAYAIFFHDIVYDPKSHESEAQSGEMFRSFTKDTTIDQAGVICDLIEATATHLTEAHLDAEKIGTDDLHFFLDFDMAILGSPPEEYNDYCRLIRLEYGHLDDTTYSHERAKVLTMFLQIPKIFATGPFRNQFESAARANIQREIGDLKAKCP